MLAIPSVPEMLMRQIVTVPSHTALALVDRLKPMEGQLPTETLDFVMVKNTNARALYARAISRTAGIYYEASGYHGLYEGMSKPASAPNAWQSQLLSLRKNDSARWGTFQMARVFLARIHELLKREDAYEAARLSNSLASVLPEPTETQDWTPHRESIEALNRQEGLVAEGLLAQEAILDALILMLNAEQGGSTSALSDAVLVKGALTLSRLQLSDEWLSDRDVTKLAKSAYLNSVIDLNLSHNRIGVPGVRALAESPYLGSLVRLDLRKNKNVAGRAKAREILTDWCQRRKIEIAY